MSDGGMEVVISNLWTELLSGFLEVLFVVTKGYCLFYFLGSFLEDRFSAKRRNGLLSVLFYTVLWFGIQWLCAASGYTDMGYGSLKTVINAVFGFFMISLVSIVFYKVRRSMTIFLIISFWSVSEITFLGIYTIWYAIFHLFTAWGSWYLGKGCITPETFVTMVQVSSFAALFFLYVVPVLVLYATLKTIVHDFREKEYTIHRTELLFLLTPELAGLLICILLRMIMIVVENEVIMLLYEKYPLLVLIVPAILLFSLLSILYGVKLFQNLIHFNEEKSNRVIMENQINTMQQHMDEMEHIYAGVRSMKHDMKNTVSVITHLAALGDNGNNGGNGKDRKEKNVELQEYLAELNKSFERLEFCFQTGNTVVDTLLTMKYHEISRLLPDLQMDVDRLLFPDFLQIHSYDIGVILGNALDNAIEACVKLWEKENTAKVFIRLSSFQKGKMFFLEIENSCDGSRIRRTQEEFPQTDKADKDRHGIGLANIKNAAAKYHGAVDWSVHENIFTLSVMMKNERGMENYVY